jgi:hypothetical protein
MLMMLMLEKRLGRHLSPRGEFSAREPWEIR